LDDPLIWVRIVHLASTIFVSGVVFFVVFIAEPAYREAGGDGHIPATVRSRLALLAWTGLILVLISGAAWLILVAARTAELPVVEILSDAAVWTVMTQTDFGHDWTARLVLTGLLAVAFFPVPSTKLIESYWRRLFAVLLAAAIVGTLAWAGHAAAGSGFYGAVHLAADILHLIAAAAWVGALVPLAVLLGAAACGPDQSSSVIARKAVLGFSTLGIVSVCTLVVTGAVNSWMLVGSIKSLVGTDYGRLLLAKIALFLFMLVIAGVNRMVLTSRLIRVRANSVQSPLRQLRNNSVIEAVLGAIILVIVGVLGTLPPGIQEQAAR
jgi:putative copper resistance protein D